MVTHIRESWGFKLMYIPQEKPDTHDTYASHASPCTSLVRFLRVVPVRGHLSRWLSRVGRILLLSRNNGSRHIPQQVGWPIHGSAHSFSPISVIEAIGESQSSVDERATHHFTGPIYLAYDQYVQYLLMGPTHQSLTDTDGGYHLGGVDFPHHSPRPFQPTVLHVPIKAPSGLKLTSST
jgi:hypothetical protein